MGYASEKKCWEPPHYNELFACILNAAARIKKGVKINSDEQHAILAQETQVHCSSRWDCGTFVLNQ